ncbi:hypothetical protein ACH0CA_01325 [Kytococcus sedentarius]|uniref:hypothetical protein n=1 Tax=Kytococcus sedentarius TaxID=1276 RepID=UPI00387A780B
MRLMETVPGNTTTYTSAPEALAAAKKFVARRAPDLIDMLGLGEEPPHAPEPIVVDGLQDASLARVRVQELLGAGWTRKDLAAELGWSSGNVGKLLCGQTERLRVATATAIRELHAREVGSHA